MDDLTGASHPADVDSTCGPPRLDSYIERWSLEPDGDPRLTVTSRLLPVVWRGRPAMVKVALVDEERRGNHLLVRWQGHGAARVYAHDEWAVLMERAPGSRSLRAWAEAGGELDDEATRILARTAMTLHLASGGVVAHGGAADLPNLRVWFADLFAHADDIGGFYRRAADLADELLDDQHDTAVLHGDIHHANVLDFGPRGWLAIDPKGLVGERAFDFANILTNPGGPVVVRPGRVERQLGVLARTTGVARRHLARWAMAWCALSAAWIEREPGTTSGNRPEDAAATLAVGGILEPLAIAS